jgi:DNA repair protein RecO (recombination protein O)
VEPDSDRRQRLYRVSALVLKRREMGEADRLLTVLTRDRGKLTLLAKGVRKPASRKAGHLEPFTHVELLVARGKNLDLVTQAETLEAHRNLREDLWRSSWAYYVVELADAFIQDEDPHELLFDLVLATLGRLDRGQEATLVVRYCELHLLSFAGYQPQLFHCVQCGQPLKPETNFLSLERGGALCPQHGAHQDGTLVLTLPALKVLRFLQSRPWEQVSRLHPTAETSQQVEALLAQYIAYHLERSLRSPVFLSRLKQNMITQ